jgi:hypothetical protein
MTSTSSATPKASISEAQLQQMAAEILQEIPGAEMDNCADIGGPSPAPHGCMPDLDSPAQQILLKYCPTRRTKNFIGRDGTSN